MTNLDSIFGEGNGTPLQYSCLANPMDGGAWHKGGVICISEVIDISPSLIPACASSSPAFLMMYSACKVNKQGDNIQP